MGVDDFALRNRDIRCAYAVEEPFRVASFDQKFAERGHVVNSDVVPDRQMLCFPVPEPMLPRPAVAVFGCFARFGIPVRTFPSGDFAHDGAPLKQMPVKGRPSNPARRGLLPKRKMIGIKKSERLARTLGEKRLAPMEWFHPRDIDVSKVEGLFSVVHPLGKRHSRAACRLNADRIETCRDKVVAQFRRQAQQVGIVRREAFRSIEECLDASGFENRHSCDCAFENRFEMVEIFGKLIEFEVFGYAFERPRL